jgi:cell division septum initiation protein DivIVA
MTRFSTLAPALLTVFLAAGCDKAMDDQLKASNSQVEANDKIAAANKEAEQKGLAAQAAADKTIAGANANFMKLREDYRHETTNNLAELDHKVVLLEANSKVATDKAKSDLDARLQQIRSRRSTFTTDYVALESASAVTWDDAKARLDKEWADLKALVERA